MAETERNKRPVFPGDPETARPKDLRRTTHAAWIAKALEDRQEELEKLLRELGLGPKSEIQEPPEDEDSG